MTAGRRLRRSTFALPAIIGTTSLFGLLVALLGDGSAHALAWAALSVPIVAVLWAGVRAPGPR